MPAELLSLLSTLITVSVYLICCCLVPLGLPILGLFVYFVFANIPYEHDRNENGMWKPILSIINPLRQHFNKPPIWAIPYQWEGGQQITRANNLYMEVLNALSHTPISVEKQLAFKRQAYLVPYNIVKALWRESRLMHLLASIEHETTQAGRSQNEIEKMIENLKNEINRSLDTITTVSVSLMRVELSMSELEIDRLLRELGASNSRLMELSDVYQNAKDPTIGK
jgi:hypothetical protein